SLTSGPSFLAEASRRPTAALSCETLPYSKWRAKPLPLCQPHGAAPPVKPFVSFSASRAAAIGPFPIRPLLFSPGQARVIWSSLLPTLASFLASFSATRFGYPPSNALGGSDGKFRTNFSWVYPYDTESPRLMYAVGFVGGAFFALAADANSAEASRATAIRQP